MKTYYDEEKHEYYVDDIQRPGVTDICSPISAQRLNALQQSVLDRARQRGSECHKLFEEYLIVGSLDIDDIATEYIPYVQQFLLWAKTYRPKVLFTEKKLFWYDFCGTCDLICQIDGKTILVDYKVTASADKKSLSVQLEGYYRLCKQHNINIDECWYLHIKKDGYVFKPIVRNERWFDILLEHNKFMKEKYNG